MKKKRGESTQSPNESSESRKPIKERKLDTRTLTHTNAYVIHTAYTQPITHTHVLRKKKKKKGKYNKISQNP